MTKRTLYFECYSGISGDMTVASLLDLGVDEKIVMKAIESLKLTGFKINIGRTKKCGIDSCKFNVILDNKHTHNEQHNHEHHHHEHRNIEDIYIIIDKSNLSSKAKEISRKIFDIIAKAEAKAHGININEVHFHEVGAIDSIIDIVATAVCIDNLNVDDIIFSKLYEGKGHVTCQHGTIPVPVPAVVNIVVDNSLELKITDNEGEMITPTGAAIVAALKTKEELPNTYKIRKIGLGAGKKEFEKANILRSFLIEEDKGNLSDEIWVLESNIDDSTSESLGYTMDTLFKNGAKDVFFTPIHMKKNRLAQKITVLCEENIIEEMEEIIFKHTTTIGIRRYKAQRTILKNKIEEFNTSFGLVKVKVCKFNENIYYYPEYEDVKNICNETCKGYKEVVDEIKLSLINK